MISLRGQFRPAALLAGAALSLAGPVARGQTMAWLDFGGAIPGGSTDPRHPKWIEIRGFGFGSARDVARAGAGRESDVPQLAEVSLHKAVDIASPLLFAAATGKGGPYPLVTLDLHVGADRPFVRLELEQVMVTGQQSSASSEGAESISLNFTKLTFIHYMPDGSATRASYDIPSNTAGSGTDPADPDSDRDGMPDAWERTYGLTVGVNDSAADADGDGLSNLHEFQLGTHPRSGTSFFKARVAVLATTCEVTWNSVAGKAYVIEWSPDLAAPFTALRTVTASAAETTASFPRNGPLGFYRVRPQ